MKMVMAILRPEKIKEVEDGLKAQGFFSLTEINVRGRGRQKGIVIGSMTYDKLPKEMVLVACQDGDAGKVSEIIQKAACTGNIGDGKIFVLNLEDAVTIRTGERGEKAVSKAS